MVDGGRPPPRHRRLVYHHPPSTIHHPSGDAVKVGIIGTGYLGRLHARILTEMPEADVIGFVEPNDEIANEVASNLKIKRYDSVDALGGEIECAVVATPTMSHFEVASQLMNAGCDVMIEKPITATVDEAKQ